MNKGKLLPPVYLLLCILLAVGLHRYAPVATAIPRPWSFLGVGMVVLGLLMVVLPAAMFKARGTAIKPFDESTALIEDGLYAFSRNPIYLGMIVLVLGVAVWLGSATPFVAPVLLWAILRFRFIPVEEAMLERTFGERYRAYKARVRRWL
ncbi:MAG TPA: isoprenylcysteine carboxylmethyltransferase family protein [Woeseiaceae bacterium]|nr:isoprenylcysteine carboxylmethyltransferase family protein [Woeseiaceae bacterium]